MHFHLPKPLHGWREFVGEVGIIVVGVLVALGAEQLVETWHWQSRADDAFGAIRRELGNNYAEAVEAASVAPCVDRQLVNLEAALERPDFRVAQLYSDAGAKFVVRLPSRPWVDYAWRTASSEGTASHLPEMLRESLPALYAQVAIMERNARETDVIAWRLRALTSPVDAIARARAIESIEELRGHVEYMALVANQLMGRADSIGLTPVARAVSDSMHQSGTVTFCRAHGIALGRPSPQDPS